MSKGSEEQREFFSGDGMEITLPEKTQRERFTAARIRKNQLKYEQVCELLGLGYGVERIGKLVGVSEHTVRKVRELEAGRIAGLKEEFGNACLRTAALLRARVVSQVDEMSGKDAAIAHGILTEKGLLLTGGATERIEVKRTISAVDVEEAFRKCRIAASCEVPTERIEEKPKEIGDGAALDTTQDTSSERGGGGGATNQGGVEEAMGNTQLNTETNGD